MPTTPAAARSDPRGDWATAWIEDVARRLDDAPARDVLRWALATFAPRVCLATSFGPQTIVIMHWLAELRPETLIVYIDTGLLFDETLALRDRLADRLGLSFTRLVPEQTVEGQAATHGDALWNRDPDRCCFLRKVAPLRRHLADHHAWLTGIRNGHGGARRSARPVEWDAAHRLVKVNPLVRWSDGEVREYLRKHDLPYNPLHDEGYPSVGCRPCTRPVGAGKPARSGRWSGTTKTECGIHVESVDGERNRS